MLQTAVACSRDHGQTLRESRLLRSRLGHLADDLSGSGEGRQLVLHQADGLQQRRGVCERARVDEAGGVGAGPAGGPLPRQPADEEMDRMKDLVREAMDSMQRA